VLEIGSSLREARRRRGVGLPEASAATMIRVRYLEALEEERVDALPEGPYQRSFLREYAEYLGLDGDILVNEWMMRFQPPPPEVPSAPPRSAGIVSALSAFEHRRALVVILALGVVGIAIWQLAGSGSSKVQPPPTIAVHHVSRTDAQPVTQPKPAAPAHHTRPTTLAALALTAVRGPCWFIARLGSSVGPVVTEQTLQQGETAKFGLGKPLWIRLGAPWNLAAAIGSRSITAALPTLTGNVLVTTHGVTAA
jgi:cytoskeletal protein RodZ